MSVLDVVCTWIGRAWSVCFLLIIAAVAVAAVRGRIADMRERRADVQRVRQLAEQFTTDAAGGQR